MFYFYLFTQKKYISIKKNTFFTLIEKKQKQKQKKVYSYYNSKKEKKEKKSKLKLNDVK